MQHAWLVVCDLDGTLLHQPGEDAGLRALTEQLQASSCTLVYNTARALSSVAKLVKARKLPCPDACACELGTKIVYFPNRDWARAVDDTDWERNLLEAIHASGHPELKAELGAFARRNDGGVTVEVEDSESHTKASLVLRGDSSEACSTTSRLLVEQLGRALGDAFVVSTSGAPKGTRGGSKMFVDVTPAAAGKGCSTTHLQAKFGVPSERVLVAGDSENDAAMMALCCGEDSPLAGVIVANATAELLEWHATHPGRRIVAEASGPLGVLEGFTHFALEAPTPTATAPQELPVPIDRGVPTSALVPTSGDAAFLLCFHSWFAAGAAALLGPCFVLEAPWPSGPVVCLLVLLWHVALAACTRSARPELYRSWRFVAVLSVFMVLPDWFLVDVLRTLVFPDDGAWRIGGAVSVYMCGMWSIPLLWVLACFPSPRAQAAPATAEPSLRELLGAALAALAIFGAAEQLTVPLNLWVATDRVARIAGHVAIYVLPAEAALGAATLQAYRTTGAATGWSGAARRVLAAVAVTLQYTGALAVSYLLVEGGAARVSAHAVA